ISPTTAKPVTMAAAAQRILLLSGPEVSQTYRMVAATISQFPGRPSRFNDQKTSTATMNSRAQRKVIAAGSRAENYRVGRFISFFVSGDHQVASLRQPALNQE